MAGVCACKTLHESTPLKIATEPTNFGFVDDVPLSFDFRFVLPVAVSGLRGRTFGLPYFIERLLAEWFRSDVELRAQLVMHSHVKKPIHGARGKRLKRRRARPAHIPADHADERLLRRSWCARPDDRRYFKSDRAPDPPFPAKRETGQSPRHSQHRAVAVGSVQVSRFDFVGVARAVSRADACTI